MAPKKSLASGIVVAGALAGLAGVGVYVFRPSRSAYVEVLTSDGEDAPSQTTTDQRVAGVAGKGGQPGSSTSIQSPTEQEQAAAAAGSTNGQASPDAAAGEAGADGASSGIKGEKKHSPLELAERLEATRQRRAKTMQNRVMTIEGTMGHDTISGEDGDDTIAGDWGDDVIDGGEGNDWIDGEGGDDVLEGGPGDDSLLGGDGDNTLEGGPGNDDLHAEFGLDTLEGGPGADTLYGGGDADVFVFGAGSDDGQMDTLGDFNPDEQDILFLGELLSEGGYGGDGSAQSLQGYLQIQGNVLMVDRDGGGDNWVPLADLGNEYTLEVLIDGRNIVVRAEDFPARDDGGKGKGD